MNACDFSIRARSAVLPAATVTGVAGRITEVLGAQPRGTGGSAWRIIDLWSDQGSPWEATILWSGGRAGHRLAYLNVARSTRVCVFANAITVRGAALSMSDIHAWASISDGEIPCENQWAVRGTSSGDNSSAELAIPPYAKFVRLELGDESKLSTSYLALVDGFGTTRARHRADLQPSPGAPVGDADKVTLTFASALDWRVTFLLNL